MATLPVYSVWFIQAQGVTSGESYTVPAGFKAVVRDIDVYRGADLLSTTFNAIGRADQVFYQHQWNPSDQNSASWRGRVVLDPGDTLDVTVSSSAVDVTVSGYLLTLP